MVRGAESFMCTKVRPNTGCWARRIVHVHESGASGTIVSTREKGPEGVRSCLARGELPAGAVYLAATRVAHCGGHAFVDQAAYELSFVLRT